MPKRHYLHQAVEDRRLPAHHLLGGAHNSGGRGIAGDTVTFPPVPARQRLRQRLRQGFIEVHFASFLDQATPDIWCESHRQISLRGAAVSSLPVFGVPVGSMSSRWVSPSATG